MSRFRMTQTQKHSHTMFAKGRRPFAKKSAPGFQGRRRYISIQRPEWGTTPLRALVGVETPTSASDACICDVCICVSVSTDGCLAPLMSRLVFRAVFAMLVFVMCVYA